MLEVKICITHKKITKIVYFKLKTIASKQSFDIYEIKHASDGEQDRKTDRVSYRLAFLLNYNKYFLLI